MAARTWHPGSAPWLQSRNLHALAAAAISGNARSRPASALQRPMPRMPGVSMSTPPPGTCTSSRATVVWRPFMSPSRTAAVSCTSDPISRFASVDLPTPLGPIIAAVTPAGMSARTSSTPSIVTALSMMMGTPADTGVATSSCAATSSGDTRSALVSTITGSAPLSNASTSSRSRRDGFTPRPAIEWTTNTTSTFAMTTCSPPASAGSRRENVPRRGSTPSISGISWPCGCPRTTQSPMHARAMLLVAALSMR